jgi:uncharacterized protein with predicted RNA binding PUA domain
MNPLPLDALDKVCRHVDIIFGPSVSNALMTAAGNDDNNIQFEYSRKTGRIKNFSIDGTLIATLRTDGGLALTLEGARFFTTNSTAFREQNSVIPVEEAVPFVSEGRSLFCRHVRWCGTNVKPGSDVAVLDKKEDGGRVIAVGIAVFGAGLMVGSFSKGVAVKVREGLSSRKEI